MLLTMSQKELNRVNVIRDVCEKRLTQIEASKLLQSPCVRIVVTP